jgi:hypothetical protein
VIPPALLVCLGLLWLFRVFYTSVLILIFFALLFYFCEDMTLVGITVNLSIAFKSIAIFTILILPMYEHAGLSIFCCLQGFIVVAVEVFHLLS